MIPSKTNRDVPIMPRHVAALLFSEDQQDESHSDSSVNISHPLSPCVLLVVVCLAVMSGRPYKQSFHQLLQHTSLQLHLCLLFRHLDLQHVNLNAVYQRLWWLVRRLWDSLCQ